MVRSNELGCRNGWNADLWVPATTDDGVAQHAQPHESIGGRARAEVEPPQQNDLITSIVAAKTDNVSLPEERATMPLQPRAMVEEDIFVRQTPSLTWSTGPISNQPATELVQDPKAAILRARDQFRERRKTEGRLADRQVSTPSSPMLASVREASMVDDRDLAEPDPAPDTYDPRYENRQLLRTETPLYRDGPRPVSPVTPREIDRPFPSMTEFPEDRARFESVPTFDPLNEPAIQRDLVQDDTWIETRQIDTVPPQPYEVDELFEEDEIAASVEVDQYEEEEFSVQHRESVINRFLRQRRERRQTIPYAEGSYVDPSYYQEAPRMTAEEALPPREMEQRSVAAAQPERSTEAVTPVSPERRQTQPEARVDAWDRGDGEHYQTAARPRPEPRKPVQAPQHTEDDFALPPPLPVIDPGIRAEQVESARPRQRIESPHPRPQAEPRREPPRQPIVDEFGDQPLFAANPLPPAADYEIEASSAPASAAFRLERICQTCRDFRPSDNGERGWCNNKWAFNHRRMVDADDLACRNSLGSWWTPKDDVWRRDGDISRHAQQTPRVDQWLFGSDAEENDRRRSGS